MMRELNVNELQEVNGGILPIIIIGAAIIGLGGCKATARVKRTEPDGKVTEAEVTVEN